MRERESEQERASERASERERDREKEDLEPLAVVDPKLARER